MDKNVSQLDPKLKEAYDRVMGTVVTPPTKAAQVMPSMSTSAMPTAPAPAIPVNSEPITPMAAANPQAVSSPVSTAQSSAISHKKSGSWTIIFMFAGIIFFVVYALVWIKMFNLKFPLINP